MFHLLPLWHLLTCQSQLKMLPLPRSLPGSPPSALEPLTGFDLNSESLGHILISCPFCCWSRSPRGNSLFLFNIFPVEELIPTLCYLEIRKDGGRGQPLLLTRLWWVWPQSPQQKRERQVGVQTSASDSVGSWAKQQGPVPSGGESGLPITLHFAYSFPGPFQEHQELLMLWDCPHPGKNRKMHSHLTWNIIYT